VEHTLVEGVVRNPECRSIDRYRGQRWFTDVLHECGRDRRKIARRVVGGDILRLSDHDVGHFAGRELGLHLRLELLTPIHSLPIKGDARQLAADQIVDHLFDSRIRGGLARQDRQHELARAPLVGGARRALFGARTARQQETEHQRAEADKDGSHPAASSPARVLNSLGLTPMILWNTRLKYAYSS